jgi:26S proteasome regulatory subunit N6
MILTEVHLLESRVYRAIGNLSKAKVSRVFLPPTLLISTHLSHRQLLHLRGQRQIRFTVLHFCKHRSTSSPAFFSPKTKITKLAYSYFFESFENLSAQGDENALGALKYMLLCKVMLNLVWFQLPFVIVFSFVSTMGPSQKTSIRN